jgi:geranylgeranyl pyrophosphate synthase
MGYKDGTKLRKRYERVTKRLRNKLPSYEATKRYEVTKKVRRGYEKGTKRLRKALVTKLPSY